MRHTGYVLGLAASLAAMPAFADIIAYSTPSGTASNQNYGSGVGMDFDPSVAITVTQLGLFSASGTGFAGTDYATLFDSFGTELAQATFGPANPGTRASGTADFFQTLLTPIVLTAGQRYSIVAFYSNGTDGISNAGIPGGVASTEAAPSYLSYVGTGRYGSATQNALPTIIDGGPANRYSAATFEFTAPLNVPAPGMLAGFVMAAAAIGRRRRG